MATINFPSTVGMLSGTEYPDPISGITYIWTGVYWQAKGQNAILPVPNYEELMPIGAVLPFANGIVPDGWLYCDGRSVNIFRTSYPDLFNALCVAPGFTPQVFTVNTAGLFSKTGHNFKGGERVRLFTTTTLPTGLVLGTDYYIIYNSPNNFYLSLSRGGSAITTVGTSPVGTFTYLQSLYGLGNGTSTFNLPDLRDEFIRGNGSIANLGAWQDDMFESHSHIEDLRDGNVAGGTGATVTVYDVANSTHSTRVTGGTETRPRNIAMNFCIKAYKLVSNSELVDVQDLVQPIQQAAADATWKLLATKTVVPGDSVIEFNSIPTDVKMIKIGILDLSPSNSNGYDYMLQMGTGGGGIWDNVAGHYIGAVNIQQNQTTGVRSWADSTISSGNPIVDVGNSKPGAIIYRNNDGNQEWANGFIELVRFGTTNTWLLKGSLHNWTGPNRLQNSAGKIALTANANKLRLLFNNGGSPDTGFDSGSVCLWYL